MFINITRATAASDLAIFLTYDIILVSGVQHMIQQFYILQNAHHKCSHHLSPHSYYIINYIPYAVHFIPVPYLFFNWKFVPINPFHLFFPTPYFPPFWQLPALGIYECVSGFFIHLFVLFVFQILHISEIIWYLFFSV